MFWGCVCCDPTGQGLKQRTRGCLWSVSQKVGAVIVQRRDLGIHYSGRLPHPHILSFVLTDSHGPAGVRHRLMTWACSRAKTARRPWTSRGPSGWPDNQGETVLVHSQLFLSGTYGIKGGGAWKQRGWSGRASVWVRALLSPGPRAMCHKSR